MTEKGKMNIFEFNHIDPSISQETISEIKALYKFYHKYHWCHKKAYKHFKKLDLALKITSMGLIASGIIAGGVTLNPIILGTISGTGMVLKLYQEKKDYKKKIEMTKFSFTTYEKVLTDLRSSLRGGEFDHVEFINKMRLIDEIIIDLCPIVDKFIKDYENIFTSN